MPAFTAQTADAFLFQKLNLWFGAETLRVVTPTAPEGTALQKDRGTDSGTVMDAEPLYVKNRTHHSAHTFPVFSTIAKS